MFIQSVFTLLCWLPERALQGSGYWNLRSPLQYCILHFIIVFAQPIFLNGGPSSSHCSRPQLGLLWLINSCSEYKCTIRWDICIPRAYFIHEDTDLCCMSEGWWLRWTIGLMIRGIPLWLWRRCLWNIVYLFHAHTSTQNFFLAFP